MYKKAWQFAQRKCSLCSQGRFNFTLGLVFIFFCLTHIITHKHTQKKRKLKLKPRIKRKLIVIHFGTLGRHRLLVARLFIQWRAYLRKSFDALKCLLMHQPMIVTNQRGEHACNVAQNCGLRKFQISTILACSKRILMVLRDLIFKENEFTFFSLTFKRLSPTYIICFSSSSASFAWHKILNRRIFYWLWKN